MRPKLFFMAKGEQPPRTYPVIFVISFTGIISTFLTPAKAAAFLDPVHDQPAA